MAYFTRYQANYKSGSRIRTILLQQDGYAGEITEWFVSTNAPRFEQGDSDSLFGENIITSIFRMEFMFDEHYDLTSFVQESRTYKVLVFEGDTTIWSGWVEPYDTSREYRSPNYFVTMAASCGLNRLTKKLFVPLGFNEAQVKLSYWQIIQVCLSSIGIERAIRVSLYTYQYAVPTAPNPLVSATLSIFRYYPDGAWMDCRTIINDILVKFNAELFLHKNMWVIRGKVDHGLGFNGYIEYPVGGGQTIVDEWPGGVEIAVNNEDNGAVEGGQVSLQSAIRRYTAKADLFGPKPSFNNGGMQLWDDSGLIGWHFVTPPLNVHGWQKKETGIPGSPYALYIKGYAVEPYFKKKKKGIWPFRKTVTTPIEQVNWVETPKIVVKKTDEEVTVGFEYYTDPGSNGFFYSIHIGQDTPNPKFPEVLWYKPVGDTLISPDFNQMVAAPHPLVNPDTGVAQSKAKVEVTFKTKEFNRNPWVNSPDNPVYTFIKIRFYYTLVGGSGDGYTLYSVSGNPSSASTPAVGDSQYKVVIEQDNNETEEGETVNLISGDYSDDYLGTTYNPDGPTGKWTRRGLPEIVSIYRAMLMDRLSLTFFPMDVIEADFKILPGGEDIFFLNYLRFVDRGNQLYKIVRYSFDEYRRVATITAVEFNYSEPTNVTQKNYTDARGLLDGEGNGDGIYPGDGTPSGRLGAEEELIEDDTEAQLANGRTGVFEDVPALYYTFGEQSTDSVDLLEFLSEGYLDAEQSEDIEEEDWHDPTAFVLALVDQPSWVQSVLIEGLKVTAIAKPTVTGEFYLTLSVADDTFGPVPNVKIPIVVYPKTKLDFTLLDTSDDGDDEIIGALPGQYPQPLKSDVQIRISGIHDKYQITIVGGGPNGDAINYTFSESVELTNLGVYRIFGDEDGFELPVGLYRIYVTTILEDRGVSRQNITFVLYDEAFLNQVKFYFLAGGIEIGQISPDGTSKFTDPGGWDTKAVIADTEHDRVVIQLHHDDGSVIKETIYDLEAPVEDGEYEVYGTDATHPLAEYNTSVAVYLGGEQVTARYVDFTTVKEKPTAEGGGIKLMSKRATGNNFDLVATLPKTGYLQPTAPSLGYNLLCDAESDEFDWEGFTFEQKRADKLVEINVAKYTGSPQSRSYASPITQSDYYAFDDLTSIQIDGIHLTPSSQRIVFTRKIGGSSGTIVAVYSADFSFGVLEDLSEVPSGEPGSGIVDYVGRNAISEEIIDYKKYFDVRVDPEIFEIVEPENEDKNWISLIEKSILFKHIQDIPDMTLIGNLSGADGSPYAVLVKDIFEEAEIGDMVTPVAIHNHMVTYVTEQLENSITGTVGYFPIYDTEHTFADSIVRQVAGKVGFGVTPTEIIHSSGNILAAGQLKSGITTGTAPLVVVSSTLVDNLHADYLNKSVIAGTGLTGGGPLTADVNIAFDVSYGDNRYALKTRQIIAGVGMAATGGDLSIDRTISLGTPSQISNLTTNSVSGTTHTHAIETSDLLPGTNVSFSTSGADRILGNTDITINVTSVPWSTGVSGKPTTISGFGIVDAPTLTDLNVAINTREPVFSKGDIIEGFGLSITGATLLNKLVGSDDVTFALSTSGVTPGTYQSITVDAYGRATGGSNPTTLSGYGITDAVPTSRTITINGTAWDLSTNRSWNVGTISGSGTTGHFAKFTSNTAIGDTVMVDTGSEINIANTRSFGVEGPAAMRDYLHVWGYVAIGTASNHGQMVIHNEASATPAANAILELRSTTKAFILPRMSISEMLAISPQVGMMVYASNGSSVDGIYGVVRYDTGTLGWKKHPTINEV